MRTVYLAAQEEGVQDAVVESLFRAYFTQGKMSAIINVLVGSQLNQALRKTVQEPSLRAPMVRTSSADAQMGL